MIKNVLILGGLVGAAISGVILASGPSTEPKPAESIVGPRTPEPAELDNLVEDEISRARELVQSRLKDPDSVKFRDVVRASVPEEKLSILDQPERRGVSREVYCGEFNAKNAQGGYSGFSGFAVVLPTSPGAGDEAVWLAEAEDSDFEGQAAARSAIASIQCSMSDEKPVKF